MSWEESKKMQEMKYVRDHPIYLAVYTKTFNRLVAMSMKHNPKVWSIYKNGKQYQALRESKSKSGWGGVRGNGGISKEAHTSLKAELETIAIIAHKTGVAARFPNETF